MNRLVLQSPLHGWALALADVCDEVFAGGLAGDGIAIDPLGDTLFAPCDGEIVAVGLAVHALGLRHASGVELLLHVGVDTVALHGKGFERLVSAQQRVRAGEPLLRFDLDRIARAARSAVTPVLVASGGRVLSRATGRVLRVGDPCCEVEPTAVATANASAGDAGVVLRRRYRIPFEHGLHARPAALLVAALRDVTASVTLECRGRQASARSSVALMTLGVQRGDEVEAVVQGADGDAALARLDALLPRAGVAPSRDPTPRIAAVAMRDARPDVLVGVVASGGLALGPAVMLFEPETDIDPRASDTGHEAAALHAARAAVAAVIDARARSAEGVHAEVFSAHLALLHDPHLTDAANTQLAHGSSAGFAWRHATRATADALLALGDPRMAERAADLRDLERQVLRVLAGHAASEARVLPDDAVLVADELLPSQLAAFDGARIAGICMARGGPTSHVALLAAARGIPMLVALGETLLGVPDGTPLLLDAEAGRLCIGPAPALAAEVRARIARRAAGEAADLAAAAQAAITRDGAAVAVLANIGALAETGEAVARGAEGCGLLRTEFLFLQRHSAPDEDEQHRVYAAIVSGFGSRPVTIRTLDVGGDKPLAYLPLPHEDNPALGVRGVRVGLRAPALLRVQLRALLRAAAPAPTRVRVMLPMVNDLAELRAVRALWQQCAHELGLTQLPALGVMIETPAAALLADQLAREADFLSIGSNDLSQYVLAMDRGHAELAAQLDGMHPAVLRLIGTVADAGRRAGRSVSVCGGLGSDPLALPLLLGLGIRELSVVPAAIARIKRGVRELDLAGCEALARGACECTSAADVRALLAAAANHDAAPSRRAAGGVE